LGQTMNCPDHTPKAKDMKIKLWQIIGWFLILEGLGSLILFREQNIIFEVGRIVRIVIGIMIIKQKGDISHG